MKVLIKVLRQPISGPTVVIDIDNDDEPIPADVYDCARDVALAIVDSIRVTR
jgi:hypothetical protein